MNFKIHFENHKLQLLLVAVLAIVFIYPPQAVLQNDLDGAVRWASDYLFEIGSPNLLLYPHTNGPLFFLKFPVCRGYSLLLSVLFDVASKFILGWYIVKLTRHYHTSQTILVFVILLAFYTFLSLDFILIASVLGGSLLVLHDKDFFKLIPAIFLAIISVYIKASISFPCLCILGSTLLLLLFEKKYKLITTIMLSSITCFAILTVGIYGFGTHGFIWTFQSIIKTLGYGNDQAIYFDNFLPYILLSVLFVALPAFLIRNKQSKQFFFISILACFVIWKYSLGRQDFVHYQAWFLICIVLAGFVVIINNRQAAIVGAVCYFLSGSFFLTNTKRTDTDKEFTFNTPRLDYLPRVLFRYETIQNEFYTKSWNNLSNDTISDSMRNLIGNSTVDVFPWGLAVLSKYNLNYKPRPNFHSTILGTKADENEMYYFLSEASPEYILWHRSQTYTYSLNAHDNIYLPNAAPRAIQSIKNNYKLMLTDGSYSLWRKIRSHGLSFIKGSYGKDIQFNKWFKAPNFDSNRAIRANIDFEISTIDKIRGALYKGRFFKITYKLGNDTILNHFVSLHSLQNGFLAQPYFTNPSLDYVQVDSIMIYPMADKYANRKMNLSYWNSLWLGD